MSEQLCKISIADIDLKDLRYKISLTKSDINYLAKSIKEIGLINPPIVRPINQKYIVVTGFNRIKATIFNNENKIVAYTIDSDLNDYQCLVKAITSFCFQREPSQAELIINVKRLKNFIDEKKIADKSVAIFNNKLNEKFVKELLSIACLPDLTLQLMHQGSISLKTAKKMLDFEKNIINNFLQIFSIIKASKNKQLEIIQYSSEICKRDSSNLEFFLQNRKISDILFDRNSEPLLKTKLLRNYLFQLRFPTLFTTRQRVLKKINSLKLGNKIKFSPPENFENPNFSVSFTAKNIKELNSNISTLHKIKDDSALKDIFE